MVAKGPLVGVVMGSVSDWDCLRKASRLLDDVSVSHEVRIISAHRTPERLRDYGLGVEARGIKVVIAGAGGSAHLPGMLASYSLLPIIGVPMVSSFQDGVDSLLSIVNMPAGVGVATMAVGDKGAVNGALLAVSILSLEDRALRERLRAWRHHQTESVPECPPS
ncbi:MAG: 5-(carboxyamino)imidazole ribonucleotide mutase [Alphaproteobacteria bacterium GM7ARS4]|nr:5-(carboxyamino)imidazole ribonucleotide mutase [Alphaproteobacteria bacterium GM7ARS4]